MAAVPSAPSTPTLLSARLSSTRPAVLAAPPPPPAPPSAEAPSALDPHDPFATAPPEIVTNAAADPFAAPPLAEPVTAGVSPHAPPPPSREPQPFDLPTPPPPPAPSPAIAAAMVWWDQVKAALADARHTPSVLRNALHAYRATFGPLLVLTGVLLVPAATVESCMVATVTGPVVSASIARETPLDEEGRMRAAAGRAWGDVERAPDGTPLIERGWFNLGVRSLFGSFLTGFLFFGLGLVLAGAAVALAWTRWLVNEGLPDNDDIFSFVTRRVPVLIPLCALAAAVVGGVNALWPFAAMLLAVPLAFVPAVALFEGLAGKAAVLRSLALARPALGRLLVLALLLGVACSLADGIADLFFVDSGRRPVLWATLLVRDLLIVPAIPFVALAWAQLYGEIRREHESVDPATLIPASDPRPANIQRAAARSGSPPSRAP